MMTPQQANCLFMYVDWAMLFVGLAALSTSIGLGIYAMFPVNRGRRRRVLLRALISFLVFTLFWGTQASVTIVFFNVQRTPLRMVLFALPVVVMLIGLIASIAYGVHALLRRTGEQRRQTVLKSLLGVVLFGVGAAPHTVAILIPILSAGGAVDVRQEAKPTATWFGPSAEWILDAALAKAKLQDKRVLVCLGSPPCSACRVLAQFLESHSRLFEDDYVIAEIDPYDMAMGHAVERRLRKGRFSGDPWMAILDADGRELICSDGPNGNIGYPNRPEEIGYFLSMIEKTKRRMSAGQIGAVRQALEEKAAKQDKRAR
jgi:hypothetical protein